MGASRSARRADLGAPVWQPDVAIECSGYILEELRDEENYAQFKKDCAEANIFIGSLIFVQARARARCEG